MAFGVEVFDDKGNLIFDAGRNYMKVVGSHSVPAQARVPFGSLNYSFSLPSTVPTGITPFAFSRADNPPAAITISGRTVTVRRHGSLQGSTGLYNARACTVYYGFYV